MNLEIMVICQYLMLLATRRWMLQKFKIKDKLTCDYFFSKCVSFSAVFTSLMLLFQSQMVIIRPSISMLVVGDLLNSELM